MENMTIKEAAAWASQYLGKNVTTANISYLIQYGKVRKIGSNGSTQMIREKLFDLCQRDSIRFRLHKRWTN